MRYWLAAICGLILGVVPPAHAAVTSIKEVGFSVENSVEIAAEARGVYRLIAMPGRWWSSDHSYSGNAANLSLEPRAGGCFCERLPTRDGPPGSVEHARVILALPNRQLRLSGAQGPLQAEAVTGTLDITITPAKSGVRITMGYVVGGYMRMAAASVAPMVDKVLAQQLARLKRVGEAGRP